MTIRTTTTKTAGHPSHIGRLAVLSSVGGLAGVLAMASCAGTLSDPDAFLGFDEGGAAHSLGTKDDAAESCPDIPTLLAHTCGIPGCHGATTKTEGLDLASPNVASRLVGVRAIEGPGLLIDPEHPPSSVVYAKLLPSPPFGVRMPPSAPLDTTTTQCVLAWITNVAMAVPLDAGASPEGGGSDDATADAGME